MWLLQQDDVPALVVRCREPGEGGRDATLCWDEFVELRNLHERGWLVSAIARHRGKDRKTVRRYLADPDARPGIRKAVRPAARHSTQNRVRLDHPDDHPVDTTVLIRTRLDRRGTQREQGESGQDRPVRREASGS